MMETEVKVHEVPVAVTKSKRLRQAIVDLLLFMAIFLIIWILVAILLSFIFTKVELEDLDNYPILILNETLMLVSAFLAAWAVLSLRGASLTSLGLSLKGRYKDLGAGVLFALAIYTLGFGLSLLLGVVEVSGVEFCPSFLLMSLTFFLLVAVTEELMVRGFILGHLMDGGVNKFLALFVSSIVFSMMHVFNPNFAFLPFLNLILAGLLLGASYLYTRNLCFPIALHWFWNWFQGPVLGYEVSGNKFSGSLLALHLPANNLLNGGTFGFEGSILCSVLMIIGTVLIIRYYYKK